MSDPGWSYLTAEDKQAILRGIDGVAYGGPFHVEMQTIPRNTLVTLRRRSAAAEPAALATTH